MANIRDIRMHRIDADEAFKDLSASSKINAEWAFLEYLRDLGRTAAGDWLELNYDNVGIEPTLDLIRYAGTRHDAEAHSRGRWHACPRVSG